MRRSEEISVRKEVPLTLRPMEVQLVGQLPTSGQWQYEPKWDGFRCLAFRCNDQVELRSKSGKSLSRFFPEVVANLAVVPRRDFVLDGELTVTVDGQLSFDALQSRLHPAQSRIQRLARETPANLVAFDCLMVDGRSLLEHPFAERRAALEDFFVGLDAHAGIVLSPYTRDRSKAKRWLSKRQVGIDGIVAKRLDERYLAGERAMLKIKLLRTVDCVVGGFRYEIGRKQVGSLLLGLYDAEGLLHHVGFTSSLSDQEKPALTARLEKLIGKPGFTGNAPGGPSRWSNDKSGEWQPLRPKLVVEVKYDHVTGTRFRHGTRLVRWRPDKSPSQCTFAQLALVPDKAGQAI